MIKKLAALALIAFTASAFVVVAACTSTLPEHKLGRAPTAYEIETLYGPDAASATTLGLGFGGFDRFDNVTIDCTITTGTGDASVPLDVYLQKLVAKSPDVWVDYIHFPKQAITPASASATYDVATGLVGAPLMVGSGTDDAGGVAMDAGLAAYGHPGNSMRLVIVTGAGTIYTPASVACYFVGHVSGQ